MQSNFCFNEDQFNRIFPFFIIINKKLEIKSTGKSLKKLFDINKNASFNEIFHIPRPFTPINEFEDFKKLELQLIVLEDINNKHKLRGQLEILHDTEEVLFIGSPWFGAMEQVLENNLQINDFAFHDPLIDLLHILKAQEIGNDDLKKLVNTINDQKEELKRVYKESKDIALFPMQNPDPLIRINFKGDILKNNPTASLLDFFEYQNKILRVDEFLSIIAEKIELTHQRWTIEASSENKEYSFVCIPMLKEGYINIYGRDITQRKQIEQQLEKQRKFYEDILNNMPADIAVFNDNHQYLFVNPRAIKNKEIRDWIINKTDEDYCLKNNIDLEFARKRQLVYNRVKTSKKNSEWEELKIDDNGEEQYVLRRLYPVLDEENEVAIIIGYGIDITERKKSEVALQINEEKYRNIITNMNLGLMEIDNKGVIEFANQTMQKMTGLSQKEIHGLNSSTFLPLNINQINTTGKQNDAFELETTVNGKRNWWLVSTAPQFTQNGTIKGSIAICLEITTQKKLEVELIRSREQAEQLAKTKETFLANMSHEIRTPMNAIIGIGNQLAKTRLTEKQHFFINTINSASENLLVIINDILDLSKIEAGKLVAENIGFELKKVLGQTMQVLLYKAEEKGLSLSNSYCDPRIAEVLIGDPYRLNQILLNLISNAIKFTDKGGINLICKIVEDNEDSQLIKFSVIDTGIGMDDEFVKVLFDKFSQEYESISRKYGGTGLGMSICKELIQLMGGKINVMSKKEIGTTIECEIPFKKGIKNDLPLVNDSSSFDKFLYQKNILIADDNEMNRLVASTILENYNATIYEATNGQEAVESVINNEIDLILMDIQMPVLNGYDATEVIRKKLNKNVPIIALTANAVKGENDKCIAIGMNDFITKPFNENDFLNCIARNLNINSTSNNSSNKELTSNMPTLYNLDILNDIGNNNKDFISKMIKLFVNIAPETVQQIKSSFIENNLTKTKQLAHRLKPSIDNLGIDSLKQTIRFIENFDLTNNSETELQENINKLDVTINQVVIDLNKL